MTGRLAALRRRSVGGLALGLLLTGTATAAEPKRYYEIRIEGQLAGYTVYERVPDEQRGDAVLLHGLTRLSFVTGEGRGLLQLSERTRLVGGRPVEHRLERIRDQAREKVHIRFEADRARIEILGKGSKIKLSVRVAEEVKRACGLYATYRHLARVRGKATLRMFDPQSNRVESARIVRVGEKAGEYGGRVRRVGLFELSWGKRTERVALDLESGWPIRVEQTAPVKSVIQVTDAKVAERTKGLVLEASQLFRRAIPERSGRYRVFHKKILVAEGSFRLTTAQAPAAYKLVDRVDWGRAKGALRFRLSGTLRHDLTPVEMRKARTGGDKRALAITCQFIGGRIEQVSSGKHAALSGVLRFQGQLFPLDLECPGLFAVLGSQFPHEPGAVAYYRIYDWKRLKRYFVRVRRLAARKGDTNLLRFSLTTPDGELRMGTDRDGRFRWLARGSMLVERVD